MLLFMSCLKHIMFDTYERLYIYNFSVSLPLPIFVIINRYCDGLVHFWLLKQHFLIISSKISSDDFRVYHFRISSHIHAENKKPSKKNKCSIGKFLAYMHPYIVFDMQVHYRFSSTSTLAP